MKIHEAPGGVIYLVSRHFIYSIQNNPHLSSSYIV